MSATTFVDLRLRTLSRTPGLVASSAARSTLFGFHERASALPHIHEVHQRPGAESASAQLFAFHDPSAWFGGPCTPVFLDRAPSDREALAFFAECLTRNTALLGPESLIEVAADDLPLVALCVEHGFAVDSLILIGDPKVARARLPQATLPAELSLVPLEAHHIEAVIALHREVFTREPERCWFGAHPSHLERLATSLESDRSGQLALCSGERLVGHVGVEVKRNPMWGRVGGVELLLAPDFVGRGLARPLYSALLDELVRAGCDTMKGGTNQPAVLHLGRVMGRPWHAFNLRREAPFTLDHFLRFAATRRRPRV